MNEKRVVFMVAYYRASTTPITAALTRDGGRLLAEKVGKARCRFPLVARHIFFNSLNYPSKQDQPDVQDCMVPSSTLVLRE